MKLTSSQTVDTDQVDILLSADSAELPGSQWNGQTVCIGPNLGKCPSTGSDNWGRSLTYVPRPEENGNIYTLYLQSVTKSTPRQPQVFGGMACDQTAGICPQASSLAVRFIVNVVLRSPVFREVGPETIQLFEAVGVPIVPPQYSVPAIGGNVSQAYINCPIRKIPFAFSLSGSYVLLSLVLVPPPAGTGDALNGATLSPVALYPTAAITDNGFDLNRISDYWSYTVLDWRPPLSAAGRRFNACVQATDAAGNSAVRCVAVEVARCFYCTLPGDTLKSVAAAYRSSWLQLWSTNAARWTDADLVVFARANVTTWADTKNPTKIPPGVLLRLGPVAVVRAATDVATLARRYQTSAASVAAANGDISGPTQRLQAGQAVCLLSDICGLGRGLSE